ncbi:hypothetical protein [Oceaniglobus trochenteri]|uniref:hypothetical protein n=1 Tax=Oceaniglobus trochenteri TaxID=2763260 RepID=UPI001CFFDB0C|nr:hypothetical protein [Oceaniglobus trochenteri]
MTPGRIIVAVHGSERSSELMRNAFADAAGTTGSVLICPLFPIGIHGKGDEPADKFILWNGLRYDHALEAMLVDAAQRFGFAPAPVHISGFSGDAQFAQRYLLVRPENVASASVKGPGYVSARPWWTGTADMETHFAAPCHLAALRKVPVQVIVGAQDTGQAFMTIARESPIRAGGANDMGGTGIETTRLLTMNLQSQAIAVRFDMADQTRHEMTANVIAAVTELWREVLGPTDRDSG